MEILLREVSSNVGWAAALALGAALAGKVFPQRPALVHGLWVLVLLKLVTPSLVHLTPKWDDGQTTIEHTAPQLPAELPRAAVLDKPADKVSVPAVASVTRPAEVQAVRRDHVSLRSWPWRMTAVVLWLGGVAAWWLAVGLQIYRFRQLLRAARPAPEALRARTGRLAARLGLRQGPTVWMVPAAVPPMIWAPIGTPRLLLPEGLWDRLDEQQQDAVLTHELAHLRRWDHWVRRLEAFVLGLYWWNPVAWWARRQVEQAEEQCCDSWVLWALPGTAEAYAEALVATAVFLSGPRQPWPVGATGVGRVPPLRRRLNMILRHPAIDPKTRPVPRAILLLGVVPLLLLPAWAPGIPPKSAQPAVAAQVSVSPSLSDRQQAKTEGVRPIPEGEFGPQSRGKAAAPAVERKVAVSQPIVREVSDYEELPGRVAAARSIEIRARVGGTIVNVYYGAEHTVEKGSPLFGIDPRPYRIELDKAEAEVNRAEIQLRSRSAEVVQTKRLRQHNAVTHVTQEEVERLEAQRDEAQASLRVAQATRDLASLKLGFTKITAPIRGKLSRPRLAEGDLVAADTTVLATIESVDPMHVDFNVPESTVLMLARARRESQSRPSLVAGLPVGIRLADENGFPRRGHIDSVDARLDLNTGTLLCLRGCLQPRRHPSAWHVCHRTAGRKRSLQGPAGHGRRRANRSRDNKYLYVVSERGVVERRPVKLGVYHDDLRVVKEGLKADEWVVVDSLMRMKPGMTIKPEKIAMPTSLRDAT